MARVTPEEVKEIIDTDLTDARITAFTAGASGLVDNNLVGKGIDEPTLKEIERWLVAHNIATTIERQAIMEKAGPAEQRFSDIFGKYLQSTTYGQTAVMLDPTGILEEIARGRVSVKLKAISEL